eukprot:2653914-Prymnesium_polylepis.1
MHALTQSAGPAKFCHPGFGEHVKTTDQASNYYAVLAAPQSPKLQRRIARARERPHAARDRREPHGPQRGVTPCVALIEIRVLCIRRRIVPHAHRGAHVLKHAVDDRL